MLVFFELLITSLCHFWSFSKHVCFEFIDSYNFSKDFIYLFLERGEGREKERERNIDVREKHQLVAFPTGP